MSHIEPFTDAIHRVMDRHIAVERCLFEHKIVGPLSSGRYIHIGAAMGFFVPESNFEFLQAIANLTRKVQFLGLTNSGTPLMGKRDEILDHPDSAGLCAWILPEVQQ